MQQILHHKKYDTVVVGGGCAGIAAAVGAAQNGANTLIIDAGPTLGGELLSGMTIDGAINARGQWIVGGVLNELVDELKKLGGYVGAFNDWRLIHYVCIDPVITRIAIMNILRRWGVDVLLYTTAQSVVMDGQKIEAVVISNKSGQTVVRAGAVVDCSGDGDICAMAGAPFEIGSPDGQLQPVSQMFRVMGVETLPLLDFVRQHPDYVAIGESEAIRGGRTDEQIVQEIYDQGQPTVFFKGDGPLLAEAIARGQMYPTALIMIQPTSTGRKEVCINTTRIAHINALDTQALSATMGDLYDQVIVCINFLKSNVPGFKNSHLAALSPRIGIRETRRITGEYILSNDDVAHAKKTKNVVAKGSHHIDIHQEGTGQIRIPVADGGSYDIPFESLVPKKLTNVLMAGRCFSADRPAHGSARVMGPCLAMGQAAGTAAAMLSRSPEIKDMREIKIDSIQKLLRDHGAILDGTN